MYKKKHNKDLESLKTLYVQTVVLFDQKFMFLIESSCA